MSYNSKYTGVQVDELLGKADTALQSYTEQYQGTITAVATEETVEDITADYATSAYVNDAIASAITATLNTAV